jgi:hypothetical protein
VPPVAWLQFFDEVFFAPPVGGLTANLNDQGRDGADTAGGMGGVAAQIGQELLEAGTEAGAEAAEEGLRQMVAPEPEPEPEPEPAPA